MTLTTDEFVRRFLLHVLPKGFDRIRHYGLFPSGTGKASIALTRELLDVTAPRSGWAGIARGLELPLVAYVRLKQQ